MTHIEARNNSGSRKLPRYGWAGIGLVLVFWGLNWSLPGLRTHWGFFPLWLGYCLVVDALVYRRKGNSLLTRNPRAYVGIFLASAPAWWLFEIFNYRTQNWVYIGREFFTNFEYGLLASISFSTVMPAVFGTAELASTFGWIKRIGSGLRISIRPRALVIFFSGGVLMLAAIIVRPQYFFPFVWLSIYFILEPINVWRRNRSLAEGVSLGDWRHVIALWVGGLICGFFWEMWNFYSYPKWVYHVPFVDFAHLFEMPLIGYGGYLPFAMELFALYHLVIGVFGLGKLRDYVQISPSEDSLID